MPTIIHRLTKLEQLLCRAAVQVLSKASRDGAMSAASQQASGCSSWEELAEQMRHGSVHPDRDRRTECETRQAAASDAAARTFFEEGRV